MLGGRQECSQMGKGVGPDRSIGQIRKSQPDRSRGHMG